MVTTVTTVTTVTSVTTVTTVTTETTVTTVTTITNIIVKYQILHLYSSKGNFFTKVLRPTDRQTDRQTDRPTTRLLELLGAAKNQSKSSEEEKYL